MKIKGYHKRRMVIREWNLILTDLNHKFVEVRGPFRWADLAEQEALAESQGYEKEQ